MALDILFEDNHLIVVNKNSGDIVQGDRTGDKPLTDIVKTYIKDKYNKPGEVYLGLPHRLDRPTSGIVVMTRTSKALERMNNLFRTKDIQKTYWAVTEKAPDKPSGTLVHHLKKNEKQNKSYPLSAGASGAKEAILDYRLVGEGDNYSFMEVDLKTGRHHQIRAQLSAIGCIIKGDLKYGARRSNKDGSIHLHARQISFVHPVRKEPLTIVAAPPKDSLWAEFERLSNK